MPLMPVLSMTLGGLLMALGLYTFFTTGATHYTALIPFFAGVVFDAFGAISVAAPKTRKHVMHAAVVAALVLAVAGAVMGLPKLVTLMSGGTVARPTATIAQSIMAGLCAIFVIAAIFSFIAARTTSIDKRA